MRTSSKNRNFRRFYGRIIIGAIHKGRPQLGGSAKSGHVRTGRGGLGQNEDVLKKSQFSTILW